MREEFRAGLYEVGRLLVSMAEAVRTAMSAATATLLGTAKAGGAEQFAERGMEIEEIFHSIDEKVLHLLAQQSPVASDLRMVITALHIGDDLQRMGGLAEHVTKVALRLHPGHTILADLAGIIGQMADVADHLAGKITLVLTSRSAERAAEWERDDDAMDELEKKLYSRILDPSWSHGVQAAVDAALLARYYERYADHAVNAGRHVILLVTGQAGSSS